MDLAVRGCSLCGVVWYRTLRVYDTNDGIERQNVGLVRITEAQTVSLTSPVTQFSPPDAKEQLSD